jgi:glycosyltransferase involved in cell wall biosynthesis
VFDPFDYSVVIPCFNRAARIRQAIRSALEQSLPPEEIVVVDDGSTDDSASLAAAVDRCVRVLSTDNRGPSAARNLGIQETTCTWVAFLDADDIWHPDKMALQAETLKLFPQATLVFCDTETWRGDRQELSSRFDLGGVRDACVSRQGDSLLFDRTLLLRLLEESRIFTSTVLASRASGPLRFSEDLRHAEDWSLWLDLVRSRTFAAVDRVLVTMHYDGDNLSGDVAASLRGGLPVLERLLQEGHLEDQERSAVEEALTRRHIAAVYHAVISGEREPGLELLRSPRSRSLNALRRLAYGFFLRLPASLQRWLAARSMPSQGPP